MRDLLKEALDIKTVLVLILVVGSAIWAISSNWTGVNKRLETIDKSVTRLEIKIDNLQKKITNHMAFYED